MSRRFPDWIAAYQKYASYGEAPPKMHFWSAVSTLAGALRRKVWINQYYFKWYPNFYIIFVAPPGIIAKTTTMDVGMDILREVPGIRFGPSVVTWQALVKGFAEAQEAFELNGEHHVMAPMTLASGEFGNLLNPQDRDMVDMLVNLWDGKGFRKETKFSGNDEVVNPWINLIACTTPAWIAGNFPEYMIGGGFTSRCVLVFADKKERLVAYPGLVVPQGIDDYKKALVGDLEQIAAMKGEYQLSKQAFEWGQEWYERHFTEKQPNLEDTERFGGYLARKQTHIHKLAMILAASESNDLIIKKDHLQTAANMVTDLELDMAKVFQKIGLNDASLATSRLLEFVKRKTEVPYAEAYRFIHSQFPAFKEYEDMLKGLIQAGYIALVQSGSNYILKYNHEADKRREETKL